MTNWLRRKLFGATDRDKAVDFVKEVDTAESLIPNPTNDDLLFVMASRRMGMKDSDIKRFVEMARERGLSPIEYQKQCRAAVLREKGQ